jgi:hypothetical protein
MTVFVLSLCISTVILSMMIVQNLQSASTASLMWEGAIIQNKTGVAFCSGIYSCADKLCKINRHDDTNWIPLSFITVNPCNYMTNKTFALKYFESFTEYKTVIKYFDYSIIAAIFSSVASILPPLCFDAKHMRMLSVLTLMIHKGLLLLGVHSWTTFIGNFYKVTKDTPPAYFLDSLYYHNMIVCYVLCVEFLVIVVPIFEGKRRVKNNLVVHV